MTRYWMVFALCWAQAGCPDGGSPTAVADVAEVHDAGGDSSDADASVGDGSSEDGRDGSSDDGIAADGADGSPPAGIGVPLVAALPVAPDGVVRLGLPGRVDIGSAIDVAADGEVTVAWDSASDGAFTASTIYRATSGDGGMTLSAPRGLGGQGQAVAGSVSFLDGELLYLKAPDLFSAPQLYRGWDAPELLPTPVGVASMLSWPVFVRQGGDVVLAFRDQNSVVSLSRGASVDAMGAPEAVGPPGAIPAVGVFGDGSLAYTYQHPVGGEPMVSFVIRSGDGGATWSSPVRVVDGNPNVHDTAMAARQDGGLDLYYIHPTATSQDFVLFRRSLSMAGDLGPPQQLTTGNNAPSKPTAAAMPDGAVLLLYADITVRDAQGLPSEQQLTACRLSGEAPAP